MSLDRRGPTFTIDWNGQPYRVDVWRTVWAVGSGAVTGDAALVATTALADWYAAQDPTYLASLAIASGMDPLVGAQQPTVPDLMEAFAEVVRQGYWGPNGPQLPDGTLL